MYQHSTCSGPHEVAEITRPNLKQLHPINSCNWNAVGILSNRIAQLSKSKLCAKPTL